MENTIHFLVHIVSILSCALTPPDKPAMNGTASMSVIHIQPLLLIYQLLKMKRLLHIRSTPLNQLRNFYEINRSLTCGDLSS